jgi:hypothetical protein
MDSALWKIAEQREFRTSEKYTVNSRLPEACTKGIFLGSCRRLKMGEESASSASNGRFTLMRLQYVLALALVAAAAQAKEPRHFQSGKLLKMESVKCGMDEKNGKSLAGELVGTDSAHMKTKELLCQEYVLETNSVVYRIRPKDDKHPVLLPIGEKAQFRLDKDKILLRVEDLDDKEREYFVVSMAPNDSASQASTESSHLNKTNTW